MTSGVDTEGHTHIWTISSILLEVVWISHMYRMTDVRTTP